MCNKGFKIPSSAQVHLWTGISLCSWTIIWRRTKKLTRKLRILLGCEIVFRKTRVRVNYKWWIPHSKVSKIYSWGLDRGGTELQGATWEFRRSRIGGSRVPRVPPWNCRPSFLNPIFCRLKVWYRWKNFNHFCKEKYIIFGWWNLLCVFFKLGPPGVNILTRNSPQLSGS